MENSKIGSKMLGKILSDRFNSLIAKETKKMLQINMCKKIGKRYLVRLGNGTYTGATSKQDAVSKINQREVTK